MVLIKSTKNPHTTYSPCKALHETIRVRNQKMLSMIVAMGITTETKVLDFGCGRGDMLRLLREKTALGNLYGMDIDPFLVKMSLPYGDIQHGSFDELVQLYPSENFDLIICSHVLEHCENPYQSLRILRRMTSRYLLLAIPNTHSIGTILKTMFGRIPEVNLGHLQVWDIGHFNNLLKRAGLVPLKWETDKVSVFPHRAVERIAGKNAASVTLKTAAFFEESFLPKLLRSFGLSIIVLCRKLV